MRLRTFFTLLFTLGFLATVLFVLVPNTTMLEEPMPVGTVPVPVWGWIVSAFAAGAGFVLLLNLTGLGRGAVGRLRMLWSTRHREAARRALEKGRQAEREDRLNEAIACYREAVQKAPYDFRSQMQLGDALRRAGRADEALMAHEQARVADPRSDEPGHALALDHLEHGNFDRARRELQTLIDAHPKGAVGPLRQLRDLEIRAGRWDAAESARQQLESILGKDRPLPEEDALQGHGIRTQLARVRWRLGQKRAAGNLLKKVLRDDPSFCPARIVLAYQKWDGGARDEARALLVEGFESTGEPALLEVLVDLDLKWERPEEAISTLRGIVAGRHHPNAARLCLGRLYLRLEMLDEAVEQLERIYDDTGRAPLIAQYLAEAESRRGRYERAAKLYGEVITTAGRAVPDAHCAACGAEHPVWKSRCTECKAFGTVWTRWDRSDTSSSGDPLPTQPLYPANA